MKVSAHWLNIRDGDEPWWASPRCFEYTDLFHSVVLT
jgi:hypothetical protein